MSHKQNLIIQMLLHKQKSYYKVPFLSDKQKFDQYSIIYCLFLLK